MTLFAQDAASTAGAGATEPVAAPRWIRRTGWAVIAVSVFGGVFPYVSSSFGLPIDGAPDWAMTTWRTVLHLVPGVVGVLVGAGLLDWSAKLARGRSIANPTLLCRAGMLTGGWFAVGPYLWGLVEPSKAVGTGGLAGAMTGMGGAKMSWLGQVIMPVSGGPMHKLTTVNCALTMGVCHWAVGALVVLASAVALGAGTGTGPLAALGGGHQSPAATGAH